MTADANIKENKVKKTHTTEAISIQVLSPELNLGNSIITLSKNENKEMFAHYFPNHIHVTVSKSVKRSANATYDNDVFLEQILDIDPNYYIFCHPLREVKNKLKLDDNVFISSLEMSQSEYILKLVEHFLDDIGNGQ